MLLKLHLTVQHGKSHHRSLYVVDHYINTSVKLQCKNAGTPKCGRVWMARSRRTSRAAPPARCPGRCCRGTAWRRRSPASLSHRLLHVTCQVDIGR